VTAGSPDGRWASGTGYEQYVGRWSRPVARRFVSWLAPAARIRWLEIGCGTGALTAAITADADPAGVVAIDPSPGFISSARARVLDPRVEFIQSDVATLPRGEFDIVVSGLVFNFLPDTAAALTAMRSSSPQGTVAAYVWDYADGMQMIRHFWDAAVALDPAASPLDEAVRFPICDPERLAGAWTGAGLRDVRTCALEVPTSFADFDDLWSPFLAGQGPAPGYVASLEESHRRELRERLRNTLPHAPDGSVPLVARAWAVRGHNH
jgi:SAM-dependent methyltransferase